MSDVINTQRLFDAKAIKFGTSTTSTTFSSVFIECLRKTLTDLQNFAHIPVTIYDDVLTDIPISNIYYSAVSYGLDYYLQDSNQFTANPIPDAEDRFIRAMKMAQRLYLDTQDQNIMFGTLTSYTVNRLASEGFVQ